MDFEIREGRDGDAWDLVGLVAECWAEYPGCVMDVHGEVPELLAIDTYFRAHDGRVWVAELDGRLAGSVGIQAAAEASTRMLTKLYVAHRARRRGLGRRLVALVEEEATARGAAVIELWTDTRFTDAHALYAACGFERTGETRELHDLSGTVEYHFRKTLAAAPG
ncbi:MAG: putative acetyltransferase [Chloroflexota bacterium]|nr:putative acetyltransferase [Chloroflexota bacterium]